jgi:circadian clock protein KaiC
MQQVTTHIQGLDSILKGGWNCPSSTLIAGVAGSGKTTFALQALCESAREGKVCLYVTSVNEPATVVNNFVSRLSHYEVSRISRGNIHQISIDIKTLDRGIYSFMWNLEDSIEKIKPEIIVIDPITIIGCSFDNNTRRRFYYEFFKRMKKWNSLVLVTGEMSDKEIEESTLGYVTDGIIHLTNKEERQQRNRYLEVLKLRGQEYIPGKHSFSITSEGITVLPWQYRTSQREESKLIETGLCGLDYMLCGGLRAGSTNYIGGPTGTGKTLMGIRYIKKGAEQDERGIIVSFDETKNDILNRAESAGMELEKDIHAGNIEILQLSSNDFARHFHEIQQTVEKVNATRIFVDDVEKHMKTMEGTDFIQHLVAKYKNANITLLTTGTISSGLPMIGEAGKKLHSDSTIATCYVADKLHLKKGLIVLKNFNSKHKKEIHEINIGENGLEIKGILPLTDIIS